MRVSDSLIRAVRSALPGLRLLENEPMSAHTSFRIGGPARLFASPSCAEEAAELLRLCREAGTEPLVIGNGTNLLVADEELDAVVLRIGEDMSAVEPLGEGRIRAGAGVPLARLAQRAQALGLSGMETLSGIPGTLGGAVVMNAGAYGGEIKDVAVEADYVGRDGCCTLRGAELDFGYRRSAFSGGDALVTGAILALTPEDPEKILLKMRELSEKRRASQPLDIPSAGSTFKRPVGGYAAALIDQAGLKGFSVGGAQVSPKHAGFVVNVGGATFADVTALMEQIQARVYETSGVRLEPEVKIIRG